jgi:hypothetical protein
MPDELYGAGERRAIWLRTLLGIALLATVALVGTRFVQRAFDSTLEQVMGIGMPAPPPAQVVVGTQLPWRRLQGGMQGAVSVGDFDADGEDEILSISTSRYTRSRLFERDGAGQNVKVRFDFFTPGATAWDFDGDGISEFVPHDPVSGLKLRQPVSVPAGLAGNASEQSAVLRLDGTAATVLYGGSTWQESYTGDFDGDGRPDLLLMGAAAGGGRKLLFYGAAGSTLGSIVAQNVGVGLATGDIDGDGRDEVLFITDPLYKIIACRYDMPPHKIGTATSTIGQLSAAELNADGVDEVLAPLDGYLDPAAGSFVKFVYPAGFVADWGYAPISGDFDADGRPDICMALQANGQMTALLMFDAAGTCTYYEELGEVISGLQSASAGGRDYVVLETYNGLRIWP